MPQLHLYVPEDLAKVIKREASRLGLSVSRYLAKLVERQVSSLWPEGYFDRVVGSWQGGLKRPPQGELETRERF